MLTAGELFAGIGGFSTGMKQAGVQTAWAIENDKYAIKTFSANHPEIPLIDTDIRKVSARNGTLSPVDILTAGFPCQSFTSAGKQEGFDDERGKLFYEIVRLVNEFGKRKPKIIIMENVPNLLRGRKGKWIAEIIQQISGAGYWFSKLNCQIIDTAELTSIPQTRLRLIMVAVSRDHFANNQFIFPNQTLPIQPLNNFINRKKKAEQQHYLDLENHYTKALLAETVDKSKESIYMLHRKDQIREFQYYCPTLRASMRPSGSTLPIIYDNSGVRNLTPNECIRLQGFDDMKFPESISPLQTYKQIGNAVSPLLVFHFICGLSDYINEHSKKSKKTKASKHKCTRCKIAFSQYHIDNGYCPAPALQSELFSTGGSSCYQKIKQCAQCNNYWCEKCFPISSRATTCAPCTTTHQQKPKLTPKKRIAQHAHHA